jgi:membrane-associated phospholipid phosphatase
MLKKFKFNFNPIHEITVLGSLVFYGILLLFFLAVQDILMFKVLLTGCIITFTITILIRTFYFKDRPAKQEYKNWVERMDASSFPSLHSARIIFLMLVFMFKFQHLYTSLLFILLALVVMISRVYLKKHDWIDISSGAFLGLFTYWIITLIF